MATPDSHRRKVLLATTTVATLFLLQAGLVAAQRVDRRGGEGEARGGFREPEAPRGGGYEERGGGAQDDERGGGTQDEGGYRSGENEGSSGQWDRGGSSGGWEQGGDSDNTYSNRRGGSVDTDKTTDGDTTTRDTTVTGADGESATHTGSVTKDGNTVTYHGDSSTGAGRNSAAAGEVTKTDNGYVARGAGVDDHGAAAGTMVKDGDQVYGRSVTTNGETVNRNYTNCVNGDCNRATLTTEPVQYGAAVPYFVPYSSYPCPGGVDMVPSTDGNIVYSCAVTPIISTTVPLAAVVATNGAAAPPASSVQVTSSAVVMYQVAPDRVVYVTSYKPQGVYASDFNGRSYWVPGAAAASQEVADAITAAENMEQPTSNATVITYTIAGNVVYLTDQPPLRGIYSQSAGGLYAWIPGATQPTQAQRDAIGTSVTVHGQQGARALADEVRRANPGS